VITANGFASMVGDLTRSTHAVAINKISSQAYQAWKQSYLFDALRSIGYGRSFCNRFGLTDNILRYEKNIDRADQYIQNVYVA
jgi:hypothetical protein